MGAAQSNITEQMNWFVGEDRIFSFRVRDDLDAVPVGIDTWTFQWVLRQTAESTSAVLTKSGSVSDLLLGLVDVPVLRAETLPLAPGRYHHALARVDPGSYWVVSEGYAVLQYAAAR